MDYFEQMGVVAGIYPRENVISACGEVTVDHFRNLAKTLYDFIELGRVVEYETNICACLISDRGRVYLGAESEYHPGSRELLDALMDGCTRDVCLSSDLEKWLSGVVGEHFEDSDIQ